MNSPISYLGGKSLLAGTIIPKFPKHHTYVEVFAGGAWLLFKKEPSSVEIINDINSDLVTLYRVVRLHVEEFLRYLDLILVSREEFERFRAENPESLTDIQKAVRFYYLLKNNFGSKLDFTSFRISAKKKTSFNSEHTRDDLMAAHRRLARVYVECRPFENVIERFDTSETLFYLDPPYYGCEKYYGKNIFSRDDFNRLKDILKGVKGKFIMSLNDRREVRKIYADDFKIEKVTTSYSISGANQKVGEVLIRNY